MGGTTIQSIRNFFIRVAPRLFDPDGRLTYTADQLMKRAAAGTVGLGLGVAGFTLLTSATWEEVLSGALLAWGAGVMTWAAAAFRRDREQLLRRLEHKAELDAFHVRLNHLSERVGAPLVNVDADARAITRVRLERLAHYACLDEFRVEGDQTDEAVEFWGDDPGRPYALEMTARMLVARRRPTTGSR